MNPYPEAEEGEKRPLGAEVMQPPKQELDKQMFEEQKRNGLITSKPIPKPKGYQISIGELIDKLAITNIKMWHLDAKVAKLNKSNKDSDMIEAGKLASLARDLNRERADLREEINVQLEGKSRGSNKLEYVKLGR